MAAAAIEPFLQHCASKCNWGTLSGKIVMDIGCGNGSNSTKKLVELFPGLRKLFGVDINENLIQEARVTNPHPRIEYHVGSIEDWSTMHHWASKIDVIVAYYCFGSLKSRIKGFNFLQKLLVRGGTACVYFTLHSDIYSWLRLVGDMYKEYGQGINFDPPETHRDNLQAASYTPFIHEIGFNVIECEDQFFNYDFRDEDHCKSYLTQISPITSRIPSELMHTYVENIFQLFLTICPRSQHGRLSFQYRTAKILLRKNT